MAKGIKRPSKNEMPVQEVPEQKSMTDVEMAERREQLKEFYTKELELLKIREEYEISLTRIEEARFARFQIAVSRAQFTNPEETEEHED